MFGEHRNVVTPAGCSPCRQLQLNCHHPHRRNPRKTCEQKPVSYHAPPRLPLLLPLALAIALAPLCLSHSVSVGQKTYVHTPLYIYIYIHTHTYIQVHTYIQTDRQTDRQTGSARQTDRYTYTEEIQQLAQTHECWGSVDTACIYYIHSTPAKGDPTQTQKRKTTTHRHTYMPAYLPPSIHPSIHPTRPSIHVCMHTYNLFLHDQTRIGSSRQVLRPGKTSPCPSKIQSSHTPTMAKD